MKNEMPFVDFNIKVPVEPTQLSRDKVRVIMNRYYSGESAAPLSEETMKKLMQARMRLDSTQDHEIRVRVYADGTQELVGISRRKRGHVRHSRGNPRLCAMIRNSSSITTVL